MSYSVFLGYTNLSQISQRNNSQSLGYKSRAVFTELTRQTLIPEMITLLEPVEPDND